jgi:hypothetical protein
MELNDWLGGAAGTHEVTLPRLPARPVRVQPPWAEDQITGHPSRNGPGIIIYKEVDKTCDSIAAYWSADLRRYREIYDSVVEVKDAFIKGMFSPPAPRSFLPMVMQTSPAGRSFSQPRSIMLAPLVGPLVLTLAGTSEILCLYVNFWLNSTTATHESQKQAGGYRLRFWQGGIQERSPDHSFPSRSADGE